MFCGSASKEDDEEDEDALLVDNLSKQFVCKSARVVNHLTFGVRQDECFGLLGVNGAGKTTTFRMLTGSLLLSGGNAYLHKTNLKWNPYGYLPQIGYCPQFHTLIDYMTCREMLFVMAHLRGIKSKVGSVVDAYIQQFGLREYADKTTADYSLGTKRKLSAALAFIGSPRLVMLDEPTTGVDPASRRRMWEVVIASQTKGTSVILTSHSMDESEVLSTRLGIMKRGVLKCLGPVQHLKTKFGLGFNVSLKLPKETDSDKKAETLDKVMDFMEKNFENCNIEDEHEGMLEYSIPYSSTDWAELFEKMEEAKQVYKLDDYSVSQATLEQVFLAFAYDNK